MAKQINKSLLLQHTSSKETQDSQEKIYSSLKAEHIPGSNP